MRSDIKIIKADNDRGYHVTDPVEDDYLGRVRRHETWRTTRKGYRSYWTATIGATNHKLQRNGLLQIFRTRRDAVDALIAHWAKAETETESTAQPEQ